MTDLQPADPLREALDAHVLLRGSLTLYCSCKDWTGQSAIKWADHREAAIRAALADHATLGLDVEAVIYAVHQAINAVPPMHVIDTEYVPQAKRRANAVVDRHAVIVAVRDALHAALTEKKP